MDFKKFDYRWVKNDPEWIADWEKQGFELARDEKERTNGDRVLMRRAKVQEKVAQKAPKEKGKK